MDFSQIRNEKRYYSEPVDRDERTGSGGYSILPASSSTASSSSAFAISQSEAVSATAAPAIKKEPMFEKVVTPSDVGKLNRLVIPKQHAEKYFPLDTSTHEKGLLLNFEDSNGKPWRFRYSYWNSSQSYVMTKGWSRFVKEKRLDAGDTVSFGRGVGEAAHDRFFIDWKRRPEPHLDPACIARFPYLAPPSMSSSSYIHPYLSFARSAAGRLFLPQPPPPLPPAATNYFYFRSTTMPALPQPAVQPNRSMVLDSVPVVHGMGSAKRVRLFGVNLECAQPHDTGYDEASGLLELRLGSRIEPSAGASSSLHLV